MKISKTDPRLTAYAFGEIDDPEERTEIAAAITADPELHVEVEAIRSIGDLLLSGLEVEAAPELSEFEKAKMEQAPQPKKKRSLIQVIISWPIVTSAAAALLALLFIPHIDRIKLSVPNYLSSGGERADDELVRYRELKVDIPPELIEGTPQPIKVPDLAAARAVMKPPAVEVPAVEDPVVEVIPARMMAIDGPAAAFDVYVRDSVVYDVGADMRIPMVAATGADPELIANPCSPAPAMENFVPNAISSLPKPEPKEGWNAEKYDPIEDTDFRSPLVAPLSTFSIDVDTASYANVRRFLNQEQLPPADAVRIEELINYFNFSDAAPAKSLEEGGDPFAVHMAQATAPWNESHRLLRIALKGYEMPWEARPASNLVFLLDVSGSMSSANKLPLVKEAMQLLTRRLDERDRVAIVVYAGASGLVLPSTTANNTETIEHAVNNLKAGGSTNAGAGINLAYKVAREHFIEGGNNRVILCTDGDFNVGQTNRGDLTKIADEQASEGVSLTILGFGMGNYKDDMLEDLSNKGKGGYAYIDSRAEARKVFLEDLASNIFKIAKDVKIQVEFNPELVHAYRLIGYENRRLKAEDFNNDKKKAGDIGPGHTVVALYELVPVGSEMELPGVDTLRYQKQAEAEPTPGEVATVKLRYKRPEADSSRLITKTAHSGDLVEFSKANEDLRFSAAVAAFGFKLRASGAIGEFSYPQIEAIAVDALGQDSGGHRSEFIDLVRKAEQLSK